VHVLPLTHNSDQGDGSVRYVDNKPFTFSNGVTLPVGSGAGIPISPINQEKSIYNNGNEYDGFRFYRMRQEEGETAKTYCVNTNHNFLTFGHGTHAWYVHFLSLAYHSPGRFFAVNEIKLMLATVLVRYDVKTENDLRPKDWEFQAQIIPDMSAKVLMRRREQSHV